MMHISKSLILFLLIGGAHNVLAWNGLNDLGERIEIKQGTLVQAGKAFKIYNDKARGYENIQVANVRDYGKSVEIDVYNYSNKKWQTLVMDGLD